MKNFWLTQAENKNRSEELSIEKMFQEMIRERYQYVWHFSKTNDSLKEKIWMSLKPITKTLL